MSADQEKKVLGVDAFSSGHGKGKKGEGGGTRYEGERLALCVFSSLLYHSDSRYQKSKEERRTGRAGRQAGR